jgi:hypothetical protein
MIKKSLDQGCRRINQLSMKLFISIIFDIYMTTFKLAGYNSKCFKENIKFLILNHATDGNRGETGNWVYSPRLCLNEFRKGGLTPRQQLATCCLQHFLLMLPVITKKCCGQHVANCCLGIRPP